MDMQISFSIIKGVCHLDYRNYQLIFIIMRNRLEMSPNKSGSTDAPLFLRVVEAIIMG